MWDWGTYFLFVFIVLISFVFLRRYETERENKWPWLLIGLIPTYLLMALRGRSVGIDLAAYEDHILNVPYFSFSDAPFLFSEPVSALIYWLSFKLNGLRGFIIITSTLHYLFLFYALKEFYKRNVVVSVLFLFYYAAVVTRSFNIVLNCLAITCSLCAYVHLMDYNKEAKYKFWFFSIMAMGIHNSALINIPVYFLCKPITRNFKKALLLRFFLMFSTTIFLFLILTTYLDVFTEVSGGQYSQYESQGETGWGLFLSRLPFIALILYFQKQMGLTYYSPYFPFLLLLFFDLIFANVRYLYPGIERMTMYTNIGSYMLLCLLCRTLCKNYNKRYLLLFLCWGLLGNLTYWLYTYNVVGGDGHGVGIMPYHLW